MLPLKWWLKLESQEAAQVSAPPGRHIVTQSGQKGQHLLLEAMIRLFISSFSELFLKQEHILYVRNCILHHGGHTQTHTHKLEAQRLGCSHLKYNQRKILREETWEQNL